jgi:hypothetical protein
MPAMPLRCDSCGRPIAPHGHYVVRVEVFADPSTPPLNTDALGSAPDAELSMAQLMSQLQETSADELQDQVHRRFEFAICTACQPKFLANPLGLPRRAAASVGHN